MDNDLDEEITRVYTIITNVKFYYKRIKLLNFYYQVILFIQTFKIFKLLQSYTLLIIITPLICYLVLY